jgi:hypothetical protein
VRFTTAIVSAAAALTLGCAASPSNPSKDDAGVLRGRTVSAIDGAAAANLLVQVGRAQAVTTDSGGNFAANVGSQGTFDTTITGNDIVERQTTISGPDGAGPRLSVIPAAFDLAAFDEMFRTANDQLQRWTIAPSLVVLASVMNYRGASGDEYSATSERLTDDEIAEMVAHLTEGLSILTGGTYAAFANVEIERPASGSRVTVARTGKIVVGRYNGILSFASTIGYGQWLAGPDGTVTGGMMFLDRDFDRDDRRRRLLRIHELGHALGYLHVTRTLSIMNPAVGSEPTAFDRTASAIAFQRPPGNRAPDIDPSALPQRTGRLIAPAGYWAAPIP